MLMSMDLGTFLLVVSGLCWSLVYIVLIRMTWRSNSYGMPVCALITNISWELSFAIVYLADGSDPVASAVSTVWFLLDCLIVYATIRNLMRPSSPDFSDDPIVKRYLPTAILPGGIVLAFLSHLVLFAEHGTILFTWTAYMMNAYMSLAFILMLFRRRSARQQSQVVAIAKFVGTLAPSIAAAFVNRPDPAPYGLLELCILCAVLDVAYIVLLYLAQTGRLGFPGTDLSGPLFSE
ncbi:Uncharacterized protein PBTT_05667 [Plasmodiophora brassicae]